MAGHKVPRLSWLPRNSLRFRMAVMFAGLLGVISTFIYLYVPDRFERVALEALQNRTEALATIQAFTVRSGVVFGDTLAISEALQGAMLGDEVLYIAVRDSAGALLTELDDRQPGSEWDLEPISASVPVMLADARIGTLELVASSHALRREARESANFIALVSLIIFTVGTLLTVAICMSICDVIIKRGANSVATARFAV